MPGVIRTRVGYAGGISDNPTYHNIGDHTETIQIEYDPDQISYRELLEIFWENHNPATQPRSRQYINILFYHNTDQKEEFEELKLEYESESGREVKTELKEYEEFYLAEDYHQKYYLQSNSRFKNHYRDIYDLSDFIDSTAVARVNGYLGRYGTAEQLLEEIDRLGLNEQTEIYLKERYNID